VASSPGAAASHVIPVPPSVPVQDMLVAMSETLSNVFFLYVDHKNTENNALVAVKQQILQARLAVQRAPVKPATLWVTQSVDYTSKYGLGYLFSNGSAGVYFNDSTKIICAPDGLTFDYIARPMYVVIDVYRY
jgi:hypothetical protein